MNKNTTIVVVNFLEIFYFNVFLLTVESNWTKQFQSILWHESNCIESIGEIGVHYSAAFFGILYLTLHYFAIFHSVDQNAYIVT